MKVNEKKLKELLAQAGVSAETAEAIQKANRGDEGASDDTSTPPTRRGHGAPSPSVTVPEGF